MSGTYTRNGIPHKQTFAKIGRFSELHRRPENYSSACKQGNHKKCKGFRLKLGKKHPCECLRCYHGSFKSHQENKKVTVIVKSTYWF